MTVDPKDQPDARTDEVNRSGELKKGFGDPAGAFPRPQYFFEPTTNKAARGKAYNTLDIGGGDVDLDTTLAPHAASQYPYNNVKETLSGHVVEYDDTPGGERILIKHRSGSGVELRADGSIVMKTENNKVESIAGSSTMVVEGNGQLVYNGNLTLKVTGDLNIDVGGNFDVKTGGNKSESINGSSREMVYGTRGSVVKGDRSVTTVGTTTNTSLGGKNDIVKGSMRHTVEGSSTYSVSGTFKQTASGKMIMTSPGINMGASHLAVFGASGTVGGAGVVHYGSTFHGDLKGTAEKAVTSDVTNSQNYGASLVGSTTGYSVNNSTTANANSSTMDAYVNQSANGAPTVKIDVDDGLLRAIDRTQDNGGLSDRTLSTAEVRSKLRDENNLSNDDFVGNAVTSGTLSNVYTKSVPTRIGRLTNSTAQVRTPVRAAPSDAVVQNTRFRPSKNKTEKKFIPNPMYDLRDLAPTAKINGSIMLEKNITLSKFLGAKGDKTTMDHIETRDEKLQIAKQFSMHAKILHDIITDKGEFKDHRLVVVEGLYKPGPDETPSADSVNDYATKGRAVVYELLSADGTVDIGKTYDLAMYWKDSISFDKIILAYDTFDPSGELKSQIILVMPEIDGEYTTNTYKNELETTFNSKSQGKELIEILEA